MPNSKRFADRARLAGVLTLAAATIVPATGLSPAQAAGVAVVQGTTYPTAIFPNNRFTVADSTQATGLRVNFSAGIDYPLCDATNYSLCDKYTLLNHLDGFDIQPRVIIPFTGAIDISSVTGSDVYVEGPGPTGDTIARTQLMQLVWDPSANTLSGITNAMLQEGRTYSVVVTSGVHAAGGSAIDACGGTCTVPFTTRSATTALARIRAALDDGSAYRAVGLAPRKDRTLSFVQNGTPDVFTAAEVEPSIANPLNGITRLDQTAADPSQPLHASPVPNLIAPGFSGKFAFGSFESPRYQYRSATLHEDSLTGLTDGEIPPVPSTETPQPLGADRLGVILVLPAGSPPAGGWPVAIYGPGFTRSKFDIFVTADYNAGLGIATIATDPSGHGYGPNSSATVTTPTGSTTFLTYGRGRDLDGDGCIGAGLLDGVGPTDHKTMAPGGTCAAPSYSSDLPSHKTLDGLKSGLQQTVVDNMALLRAVSLGVNVPTVGHDVLSHTNISYYGLSFGSIYGTMLMATDPLLTVGLLNVGGGPIVDIARLSGFRGNLRDTLAVAKPSLLNGGPGLDGFTEQIPLRQEPPQTGTLLPGAATLQELFADTNWYDRSGSPEGYAPLLRLRRPTDQPEKRLLFQTAYGDATVPNPTAGTMYRAGNLFDLVTYFRHDKSAPGLNQSDPHGWLADPTIDPAARTAGEQQLGIWLASGGTQRVNTNPLLLEMPPVSIGNFDCLHYPEPQTGVAYSAPAFPYDSRECPTIAADQNAGWE